MLDLHEGVVDGLAVAKLELDLNQTAASRETLIVAFDKARTIVSASLEGLRGDGTPLGEWLGDPAYVDPLTRVNGYRLVNDQVRLRTGNA